MLIIDADLYVYKAGFAHRSKEIGFKLINRETQEEVDLGNLSMTKAKEHCGINGYSRDDWKLVHYNNPTPLEWTLGNLNTMIESLMNRFNNPDYVMYLTSSDHSNYRFDIATITPYKGSRKKCNKCFERTRARFGESREVILTCKNCGDVLSDNTHSDKPHYYDEIREHLMTRWNAVIVSCQEADDAVSIHGMKHPDNIMVHIDKDIDNTPGRHYNPDKNEEYHITNEEAINHFYTQFLLGDNIDCIPGVEGCGPVAAKNLFKGCTTQRDYEEMIMSIYQGCEPVIPRFKNKMCLTYNEAYSRLTEIGQLLHIRQEENELWTPTIQSI